MKTNEILRYNGKKQIIIKGREEERFLKAKKVKKRNQERQTKG